MYMKVDSIDDLFRKSYLTTFAGPQGIGVRIGMYILFDLFLGTQFPASLQQHTSQGRNDRVKWYAQRLTFVQKRH